MKTLLLAGLATAGSLALPLTDAVGDEPEEVRPWNIGRMRVIRHQALSSSRPTARRTP